MTNAILRGKPDAGNPHVRFDEGEVASAKPRRGSLLYRTPVGKFAVAAALALGAVEGAAPAAAAESARGENLIRNADFAEPVKRPWSLSPGVVRKETAALSGDWTLSALGKNYHIIGYFDPDLSGRRTRRSRWRSTCGASGRARR